MMNGSSELVFGGVYDDDTARVAHSDSGRRKAPADGGSTEGSYRSRRTV